MINGKKLIEIRRVGFLNKGAELMLLAVLEKLKFEYPDAEFVMETARSAPYKKRALLGFYQKPGFFRYGIQFGVFFDFVPSVIKSILGIVTDKQVDIVIDAAGFAYSDQWGTRNTHELANACKRSKKNGTKIILMPQAFGPFDNDKNKAHVKDMIGHVDLLFAREEISYNYLVDIVGERKELQMAPDFTNLIEGVVPGDFDKDSNRFCIVPNYRMIDKTSQKNSDAYLPLMIDITRYVYEKGQKPFILVHEGDNDLMLAEKIRDAVSPEVQIIKESDPLKIKGILGVSSGTVGSRFHGLVSALSQGTPALATGWSHKYEMLFQDYGFPEGLIDVGTSLEDLYGKIDLIIDNKSKGEISERIEKKSLLLKERTKCMWKEVMKTIND